MKKPTTFTILGGQITMFDQPPHPKPTEDALWLAHFVNPKENETCFDFGCGNGAVSLAVLHKQPKAYITGFDVSEDLAFLSAENAELNKFENFQAVTADVLHNHFPKKAQHVFSNPPFHATDLGFKSKNKQQAHGASIEEFVQWVAAMIEHTAENGTITIIHHAQNEELICEMLDGMDVTVTHLVSKEGKPAKRIIVQAIKQDGIKNVEQLETYDSALRKLVLK